jgi:hypothetical protein
LSRAKSQRIAPLSIRKPPTSATMTYRHLAPGG